MAYHTLTALLGSMCFMLVVLALVLLTGACAPQQPQVYAPLDPAFGPAMSVPIVPAAPSGWYSIPMGGGATFGTFF